MTRSTRCTALTSGILRLSVALLASSPIVAFAPDLVAQPARPGKPKTVREELPPSAVRAWDDGRLLLQQQNPDYEKALVKFREAYEASANPRVLYNVAVCQKNLNQYARAAATFRQELKESNGRLSQGEVSDIEASIAALERFVATVAITVNEEGAEVLVDGDRVGVTPLAGPLSVDIGTRAVRVRKAGFVESTKDVLVRTGDAVKLSIELEATDKKARVSVTVVGAPGATITMDGTDLGPAPFTGEVGIGRHTFTASAGGFVTATQTSEIRYREAMNITLALAKKRQEGRLRVEASVPGATIEIDGKAVGSAPWEGIVASGSHQVIARKSGYDDASIEISMTDDASLQRKLSLAERRSSGWAGWAIGAALVVGGSVVAGYFLLRPQDETPIAGTLRYDVGEPVPAIHRF